MKKILCTVFVLTCISSTALAELRFIQDSQGVTSHVLYNGQLLPIDNQGMITVDGHLIPVTVLQDAYSTPQSSNQQSHPNSHQARVNEIQTQQQYTIAKQNQYHETTQEHIDLRDTKREAKNEARKETKKILGHAPGSGVAGALVNDILDSLF